MEVLLTEISSQVTHKTVKAGSSVFHPSPRTPIFMGEMCFLDFLFSVAWLPGFHFTCELISVTCLSGSIFSSFLVLCFRVLARILRQAFAAPPTHMGKIRRLALPWVQFFAQPSSTRRPPPALSHGTLPSGQWGVRAGRGWGALIRKVARKFVPRATRDVEFSPRWGWFEEGGMVNGRTRSRGDARCKMLPEFFPPKAFLRGRRWFGCTVVGNKFASSTQNRKSS